MIKHPDLSRRMVRYDAALSQMIADLADEIVVGARTRVYGNLKNPRGNSPLAESIRSVSDPEGGLRVFTDKPYARYVEFGTVRQPARPFLTPAIEEVKVTFAGLN